MPYNTFAECINENSLTQHVYFPTRESNILDLVFTADPILVSQVTSLDHFSFLDSVSDHTALALCLNIGLLYEPATETPTEKHFDFRRANLFLLKSLITAVNWEMLILQLTLISILCSVLSMICSGLSVKNACPLLLAAVEERHLNIPSILLNLAVNANGYQNVKPLSPVVCFCGEQHSVNTC